MQKNVLLRKGSSFIRVLDFAEDAFLVIDCVKETMPVWVNSIEGYEESHLQDLCGATGLELILEEDMSLKCKKVAHRRYSMIAGLCAVLTDQDLRSAAIHMRAEEENVSAQTIRKYLCRYLVYQDLSALRPVERIKTQLSKDEKNMRWALNKFYYTKHRNSLKTAYTYLLKEKYCDGTGILLDEYPSFYQFRYFYRKTRDKRKQIISREGLKCYQKNYRPLLGDGVQEFAPNVGVGMVDSTICDIFLVNSAGELVGRPILIACVDANSSLCCGYSLLWEGGVYSIRELLMNVIADKSEMCRRFGVTVAKQDWNCSSLPGVLVTDLGKEYVSQQFEQITELGVKVINLPAYRPELKGPVEKFFDLIQESYKVVLKGKGVIESDFQERGAHDYRQDALLTIEDFEKVIIRCIVNYNCSRIVENFPFSEDMLQAGVKPYASSIWNWGMEQLGANMIPVTESQLFKTLLPRTEGRFTRNGLIVNKLRYGNPNYQSKFLEGGTVLVAYNPDDVSAVWLVSSGSFEKFDLIEQRYCGFTLDDVNGMKKQVKSLLKDNIQNSLQGNIELINHIGVIVNSASQTSSTVHERVSNKSVERQSRHRNYLGGSDE